MSERVIEIPWALTKLPQAGVILDVGSCEATYLPVIQQSERLLHCLDPRDCRANIPEGAVFHHQSIIGNDLPRHCYDAALVLSTIEHIGLPHYGQQPFLDGDVLALVEVRELLKPGCPAIFTVPVGRSKITNWYRQYRPQDLKRLFERWETRIVYWGRVDERYVPIEEDTVENYDYAYRKGAGALAGIIAIPA